MATATDGLVVTLSTVALEDDDDQVDLIFGVVLPHLPKTTEGDDQVRNFTLDEARVLNLRGLSVGHELNYHANDNARRLDHEQGVGVVIDQALINDPLLFDDGLLVVIASLPSDEPVPAAADQVLQLIASGTWHGIALCHAHAVRASDSTKKTPYCISLCRAGSRLGSDVFALFPSLRTIRRLRDIDPTALRTMMTRIDYPPTGSLDDARVLWRHGRTEFAALAPRCGFKPMTELELVAEARKPRRRVDEIFKMTRR